MDELKRVKRLSEVKSSASIKFLSPAVSPGCHCPMRMASLVAKDISGLSSLLVGMPECATHARLFNPKPEGPNGELHWLYALDLHEVVLGIQDGIISALKKMDKAGAKAILLIVTCIPELLGEDIEGILREAQSEISCPVAHVMLGQFKNFSYPPGYWKTLEALGAFMKAGKTDPHRINVLGSNPNRTEVHLSSLFPELERHGLALRLISPGASLNDFQVAPDAALNLVISPYAQPLAARMEKEFGVPFIALHTLFSVSAIDKAYEAIGDRFGLPSLGPSWSSGIALMREKALLLEEQARTKLSGLRFITAQRCDMPLALAGYLASLGMEALLLHMEEFYPEDLAHAKALLSQGQNPYICRMVNLPAEYPALESLSPDICFGNLFRKESKTVDSLHLQPERKELKTIDNLHLLHGTVGYELTCSLLEKTLAALNGGESHRSS